MNQTPSLLGRDELIVRWRKLVQQIEHCAEAKGRDPKTIQLLAVSKTHPPHYIEWVAEGGQLDFGENYVQEVIEKQKTLKHLPLRWHFIGHLQKNKVKNVVGQFHLIHSVDSFELAQKIARQAGEINRQQGVLLEVNLAEEKSKHGFSEETLRERFAELIALPHLKISGLMALPPLGEMPEESRPHFKRLKHLFEELKLTLPSEKRTEWKDLSMGTSHDYDIAIEEGATIIRVGTALFGQREK